jgi:outer membrane protein assembly factor BamB
MKSVERGTPVTGFYIRKSRKRVGLMKYVEGTLTDVPIVLVDDLINSGKTINKQIEIIHTLGKTVREVYVLLAYRDREAYAFLKDRAIRLETLFTLTDFELPLQKQSAEVPQHTFSTLWHYGAHRPSHHIVVQKSAPILHGENVLFGCDDGVFVALNQMTGHVVWQSRIGRFPNGKGILSSPVVYADTVYFGGYDGVVYALDARTGEKRWTYHDADWIGSSPALSVDRGLLFIGLEFGLFKKRGGIVALNLETGKEVWRVTHRELTHSSPFYIAVKNMVVIGSNDGKVYAYDAMNGTLLWEYQTLGDIKTSFVYDKKRNLIAFGSMDGKLYVLSVENGSPIFARSMSAGIYSTPLIDKDTLYVASLDKYVYAIDMNTWKDQWEFGTGGRIFATPIIAEGSLWIGSNDGRLYELDPQSGRLVSFFQVTERIVNRIVYNEKTKRFFVPTSKNEMYCIERAIQK